MSRFLNERLNLFEAYVPGEQPQDKKYIKLNTNELAYPPSPRAISAATEACLDMNLYPDPEGRLLKSELAAYYGLNKENIFLSNGSDETLSFLFMSFFEKGIAFADITYGFYEVYSQLYGIKTSIIPLKDDFSICAEDYFGKENVIIANPNAPTGQVLSVSEIEAIIENVNGLVVIDEAYADFGDVSCVPLTEKYDNLMVVGTFSKSRAMAGARLGFAVAGRKIIDDLEKIKYSVNPYNINRMTMAAGIGALKDDEYFRTCVSKVRKTRESISDSLLSLGFELKRSSANFIFPKMPGFDGNYLYSELKKRGILVRHFGKERIKDHLRISIGTDEQMEALLTELTNIINER